MIQADLSESIMVIRAKRKKKKNQLYFRDNLQFLRNSSIVPATWDALLNCSLLNYTTLNWIYIGARRKIAKRAFFGNFLLAWLSGGTNGISNATFYLQQTKIVPTVLFPRWNMIFTRWTFICKKPYRNWRLIKKRKFLKSSCSHFITFNWG